MTYTANGKVFQTFLLSEDFCQALIKAGVLAPGPGYQKITVIAEPNKLVRIEVVRDGDERLLSLVPELAKLEQA